MATGDTQDIVQGLKSALPRGWFGSNTPVLDALLTGIAAAWTSMYSIYQYVQAQTRIRTATGIWLDFIALDYFGNTLPRLANELDDHYRARILTVLFAERGTRNAIYYTLLGLTGRPPLIFEPARPADTGAYGCALGYGAAGGYGSLQMAYQALVTAYMPATSGIPLVAGYGVLASPVAGASNGAYNTPAHTRYALLAEAQPSSAATAIYQAVDAAKPAGTTVWVSTSA